MSIRHNFVVSLATASLAVLSLAGTASALTASCTGTPSATAIAWSASASDGVAPFSFLWGNGSTSSAQTIAELPGTYSMTLQATDASSTIATTTCSATVSPSAPIINSFISTPAAIIAGQSSSLSWNVSSASSTSIDNGIGLISSTSVTVAPSVTTTYHLTAVNPGGTTSASVTVTVTSPSSNPSVAQQIQNLLNQINALKAQIVLLLQQQAGGGTGTTTPPTPPPFSCARFQRDLGAGDDGDDVKSLQTTLASDPTIFSSSSITGFFGPKTQQALMKFQRKNGIIMTGFFGQLSRDFLGKECPLEDHGGTSTSTSVTGSTSIPSIVFPTLNRGENGNGSDHGNNGNGNHGGHND